MNRRDVIAHEIVYPYRIDAVWDALTDQEQLAAWLMENDFTDGVGSRFSFYDHEPWADGTTYDIVCEVLIFDPPHRLAYSWESPPKLGRTLVEWELIEVPTGTRVQLTHSGFAKYGDAGREAVDMLGEGWGGLLRQELAEHLKNVCTPIATSSSAQDYPQDQEDSG